MNKIKEVTYKKIVFYKNISKDGGAQDHCIENKNDNDKYNSYR